MRRITYAFMPSILLAVGCGDGGSAPAPPASLTEVTNASDYEGEYTRTDGTPIYIVERGGGLLVMMTRNVFGLVPAGPDRFDPVRVSYCSAMPPMVGRYLEVRTGRSLPDYAHEVLFEPLGIARDHWTWDFDLRAHETPHGAQVHLRPATCCASDGSMPIAAARRTARGSSQKAGLEAAFTETAPLGDWRRYGDYWWTYDVDREVPTRWPSTWRAALADSASRSSRRTA